MSNSNLPLGVIDSGVGGLSVVKELKKQLPNESILYVGDNLRCPYGSRENDEIIEYTSQMAEFLVNKGIKLLVVACNTATAVAISTLRKKYNVPIVGVVTSGARVAARNTVNNEVAVIATKATVASGVYKRKIQGFSKDVKVHELACQNLVSLVESGNLHTKEAYEQIDESLAPLKATNIDTLILGCTHFPLIQEQISNILGPDVKLINAGKEAVETVSHALVDNDLLNKTTKANSTYYTTGELDRFKQIATDWLEEDIKLIKLEIGEDGLHEVTNS